MKIAKSYSILASLIILISLFNGLRDSWKFFLIVMISLLIIYISIEWPKNGIKKRNGRSKKLEVKSYNENNPNIPESPNRLNAVGNLREENQEKTTTDNVSSNQ